MMRQLRRNGIATKNWRRMWQHFTRRANSPSMARVKPRSQRECRLSWHFDVMAWSSSDASDSGKRGSFVVGKSKNSWAKTSFFTLCVQSVKKRCDLAVVVVFFWGDPTHVFSTKSLRAHFDVLLHQKNVQKFDQFFAIPCYKIVYRDFFGNLLKICDMFWHEIMFPFRTGWVHAVSVPLSSKLL